jgi:hypothetical protein
MILQTSVLSNFEASGVPVSGVPVDCLNTRPERLGENATPEPIIAAARYTLGGTIALDPASSLIINQVVQAERFFTAEDDGLVQPWESSTLWLNPPGTSKSRGKTVKSAHWFKRLWREFQGGAVGEAIALCYRAGSVGVLGVGMLEYPLCITAYRGNPVISTSGRISYEVIEDGQRVAQDSNTQSSVIVLLSNNPQTVARFQESFLSFGVVKQ